MKLFIRTVRELIVVGSWMLNDSIISFSTDQTDTLKLTRWETCERIFCVQFFFRLLFSFSKFLVTVKRNAYKCCFENGRLLKRWSKIAHQNLNHTQALFNVVRMTKSYIFFCLLKICNRNYFISSFVRSNSIRHQNC